MSGEAWETRFANGMPLYQLVGALAEEISGRGVTGDDTDHEGDPNVWEWLEQRGEFDLARCVRDLYDHLVQLEPLFKMCTWRAAGDSGDDDFEREAAAFVAKLHEQRRMVNEARLLAFADAMRMPRPVAYRWSPETAPSPGPCPASTTGVLAGDVYRCSLRAGHTGDHEAHGRSPQARGELSTYLRWPDIAPKVNVETLEYCGARSGHGERCIRQRGHDESGASLNGEHKSLSGSHWLGNWCEHCEGRTDAHSLGCPDRKAPNACPDCREPQKSPLPDGARCVPCDMAAARGGSRIRMSAQPRGEIVTTVEAERELLSRVNCGSCSGTLAAHAPGCPQGGAAS